MNTNHPARDLNNVIDETEIPTLLASLSGTYYAQAASLSKISTPVAPGSPQVQLQKLADATAVTITNLTEFLADLRKVAAGEGVIASYLRSASGQNLTALWNAILNGDLPTISSYNSYEPNDIGRDQTAMALFRKLLLQAGVQLQTDGGGGGLFSGDYRGQFYFMVGEKGLSVVYHHKFDKAKNFDEKTHTYEVIAGKCEFTSRGLEFKASAEPNKDPAAVAEMASAIAAKLFAHYGPRETTRG